MARPPAYTRDYSFSDYETNNPGVPKPGAQLDTEYDDVSNALTGTQNALALIQRDDGQLANDSVGVDQLQDDVFDGIGEAVLADCEEQAAIATAAASSASANANAAFTHASAANNSKVTAQGAATQASASQGIAQGAADAAALSAAEAADSALEAEQAASATANSVAETVAAVETAYKWAEYLAAPVMPAPDGYPEAVDDGMWSAKWWALRARDYQTITPIDFGSSGAADISEAYDDWIALGNTLPPGHVIASWNGIDYWLIDPTDPSDPNSWVRITGDTGPIGPTGATGATGPAGATGATGAAGPPNILTVGTTTTGAAGSNAAVSITGTTPAQVINFTIPTGAQGPQGIPGPPGSGGSGAGGDPTATIGLSAVLGVATTLLRSDGAPALSQAIAPTWTGTHKFTKAGFFPTDAAVVLASGEPVLVWSETDRGVDEKSWRLFPVDGQFRLDILNDANNAAANIMTVSRTGMTVGTIAFTSTALTWNGQQLARLSDLSGAVSGANPSVSVGLAAKNGSALTFMRSDAAPALDQGIAPTWTAVHIFQQPVQLQNASNGAVLQSASPSLLWNETDAAVDNKRWRARANAETFTFDVTNDANSANTVWLAVDRTLNVIDSIALTSTALTWNGSQLARLSDITATAPGGATTQVQFNNAGAFAGSADFTWTQGTYTLTLGVAGNPSIKAGAAATTSSTGRSIGLYGGPGGTVSGGGGTAFLRGGVPSTSGQGGPVSLIGEDGVGANMAGGNININAGAASGAGAGGTIDIQAGVSPTGTPGYARIITATVERLRILGNGAWSVGTGGAATGTSGQALTSTGATTPPTWQTIAGGITGLASPTASLGLAAINGSATTAMRSDGAPALSQAIAPTWTGKHVFNFVGDQLEVRGNAAVLTFNNPSAAANGRLSRIYSSTTGMIFDALNDAQSAANTWMQMLRTGTTIDEVILFPTNLTIKGNTHHQGGNVHYFFNSTNTVYTALRQNGTDLEFLTSSLGGVYGFVISQGGGIYNRGDYICGNGSSTAQIGMVSRWAFRDSADGWLRLNPDNTYTNGVHTPGNVSAATFTSTSSRAIKRETGLLTRTAKILRQLRPILYRLLDGDDSEQAGLIAEEVHAVCPWLSRDGKSVAYDRLAILLLADWQAQNGVAYE